ncbi:putative alpha-1,2-mannosidase precursor [Melioribacter roseus P3M-2]|uniref:Putative alpha-1,2-mannosidase n=1 Tax=Melioribacter roseus (strain DSM 23840 / JCM 17771 / VKM B-2668 / P3M-2) TaxID=1191523 RepID=I6ZRZ1_MELRP|nr:GH92 family glycosyl hydrolase [Melioribacter roseus]AFN74829.1 putative alpha-1,2-mannosidase precursor [Melioribacter roseus P3M-2]
MKVFKFLIAIIFASSLCVIAQNKLTDFVNPFVGTDGHGHTYPGASLPFGMVQLSPDTDTEGWDWCSGYHYSDNSLIGFSHTHLSGTGCADYGDILFMPTTGELKLEPGSKDDPDSGYRSRFKHESEKASPGYYSVFLEDYKINVELTVTKRAGYHKYVFPESENSHILIDLAHGIQDRVIDSKLIVVNDTTVKGYRRSAGWAKDHTVYFYAVFSKPFESRSVFKNDKPVNNKEAAGKNVKAAFHFRTNPNEPVYVKVGISHTSLEGAEKNLKSEINQRDFDSIKKQAEAEWENRLSSIVIEDSDATKKRIFYTALYHAFLSPNILSDVDGSYIGMDGKIHHEENFTLYTVFSLWDTFRALHPLFTIIAPKENVDMINSMLRKYEESGQLPIWELASNETGTMIGYHSIPVIADAIIKNLPGINNELALKAMKRSAMSDARGLNAYKEMGYIPSDHEHESVSKTLEYSYDDWCIAQVANVTGDKDAVRYYLERSKYYVNLFDPVTRFFRPKKNGKWVSPFDPYVVSRDYTEANSWQYSFFAPHDVNGLIDLFGGDENFDKRLDELFNADTKLKGRHQPDISGLIGQYAHGNEPSHHIAYLYNYIGKPYKTQEIVNRILNTLYTDKPDGLSGNEDCGQMSAWYVLSSLGFYPVCPGQDQYIIGKPHFEKAVINLENGNSFVIKTQNLSDRNIYIGSAKLNGSYHAASYITHKDIINGGNIVFEMVGEPTNWGFDKVDRPQSYVDLEFIPIPFIKSGEKVFKGETVVELESIDGAEIYYVLDSNDPKTNGLLYNEPIIVNNSTLLKFVSSKDGIFSKVVTSEFHKVPTNWDIHYNTMYDPPYTGGGKWGLIDGIRGNENFNSDAWQGYEGKNLNVVIDLGNAEKINELSINFLQNIGSWIFLPEKVEFYLSLDGKNFVKVYSAEYKLTEYDKFEGIKHFGTKLLNKEARYIKIIGKNIGVCPSWHPGAGGKAWIFVDEININ